MSDRDPKITDALNRARAATRRSEHARGELDQALIERDAAIRDLFGLGMKPPEISRLIDMKGWSASNVRSILERIPREQRRR